MFARKDIVPGGLLDPADLTKAKDLVYGGQQPFVPLDLHGRMALTLLGVNYKYVRGYVGAVAIRLAIEKGEANVTTHALQGYRAGVEPTLVRDVVVVPLWHFPARDTQGHYQNNPMTPEMPSFVEVLQRVNPRQPSGIEWEAFELLSTLYGNLSNVIWGPPEMIPGSGSKICARHFLLLRQTRNPLPNRISFLDFNYAPVADVDTRLTLEVLEKVEPKLKEFYKDFVK